MKKDTMEEFKNLEELRKKLNITIKKYTVNELLEEIMSVGGFGLCPLCGNLYKDGCCCGDCGFGGRFGKEITIRNHDLDKCENYLVQDI